MKCVWFGLFAIFLLLSFIWLQAVVDGYLLPEYTTHFG